MAWSVANSASKNDSGTTGTLAFPGACTPNSRLLLAARIASTPQSPTVSDPTNGSWTKRLDLNTNGDTLAIFEVLNTASSALTVTLANSTSGTRRWVICEATNGTNVTTFDKASTGATGTSTTATSDAITPAANDALLFMAADVSGAVDFTATGGLTEILEVVQKISTGFKVVATPASTTGAFTLSGSDVWGAGAIFINSTAAGGSIGGPALGGAGRIFGGLALGGRVLQGPQALWREAEQLQRRHDHLRRAA